MNIRLVIAGVGIGALLAGAASADTNRHHHHRLAARTTHQHMAARATHRRLAARASHRRLAWQAYGSYGPASSGVYEPASAGEYAYPAAYQAPPPPAYAPPPPAYSAPPAYVRGGRYYGGAIPGDTSPGADFSVRLPAMVDPTQSVTAAPNPNNVSDQVPSHGYDFDGVPPDAPY